MGHMTRILSQKQIEVLKYIYDKQRAANTFPPFGFPIKRQDVEKGVKYSREEIRDILKSLRREEMIDSDDMHQTWYVTDDGHRFVAAYWD